MNYRKIVKKVIENIIMITGSVLLIFSGTLLHAANGSDYKDTLKEKLIFYYIRQPDNTDFLVPKLMSAQILWLDNYETAKGSENGPFWENKKMYGAHKLIRALFRDEKNGGDLFLQKYAAEITGILNKPVLIYLYDDATAPLWSYAQEMWKMPIDDPNSQTPRVWPSAKNQAKADDTEALLANCKGESIPERNDQIAGFMHLGAHYMNTKGEDWAKGKFIHELVHTQDFSDNRVHLFTVSGQSFKDGADNNHYEHEAIPDLARTYQEGIAQALTMLYQTELTEKQFDRFAGNDLLWVEISPYPPGTDAGNLPPCLGIATPSKDVWLYNQLSNSGAVEIGKNDSGTYAAFKIRDVKAKFILHNEMILALIFSECARRMGLQKFMSTVKSANSKLYRVCASGIAVMSGELCKSWLPENTTLESIKNAGTNNDKPYLLPLAYVDYFTGFEGGDTDAGKVNFKKLFEGLLSDVWIDLYWDTARSKVRSAVNTNLPKYEDLTAIASVLGIHNPTH